MRSSRVVQPVYRITGAQRNLFDDVNARQRRYVISMAVRTVCFLLAILADGWVRWGLVLGALVLPYVAVVMANGGREHEPGLPLLEPLGSQRAIGSAGGGNEDRR